MSELFYGSICISDLLDNLKAKHSAFTKGNNGKIYGSVSVWLNDKEDKFGNIMSIQITPSKEMKDLEKRIYIGNCKKSDGPTPISDRDISHVDTDYDIPTRQTPATASQAGQSDISGVDDLPF